MTIETRNSNQTDWPEGLVPAEINQNPRSTSGRLIDQSREGLQLYFKRSNDTESLEREAAELQRATIATNEITHVEPVRLSFVAREQRLLITEYIDDGESLFNYIWNGLAWWKRGPYQRSALVEIGMRLGQWLSTYHESSASVGTQPLRLIRVLVEQTNRKLEHSLRESKAIAKTTAANLQGFLKTIRESAKRWIDKPASQIHADFTLSNILIDSTGKLYILDFADAREGFPCEDLVRLWHELWTISQLSPRRKRILDPCLNALMQHYKLPEGFSDGSLFFLARCWNAVCNILATERCSRQIGFRSGMAACRLARVNARWLASVDWLFEIERLKT